jgi:hypothetical protein
MFRKLRFQMIANIPTIMGWRRPRMGPSYVNIWAGAIFTKSMPTPSSSSTAHI